MYYIAEVSPFCFSGDQILEALENGVSQWPKLEGRFPQVCVSFEHHVYESLRTLIFHPN